MTRDSFPDTWVPSRYNVSVDLPGGVTAVFNTRTLALATLEKAQWQRCLAPGLRHGLRSAAAAEPLFPFYAKGLLVSASIDELDLLRLQLTACRYRADVAGVRMTPTLACNLRCPYCAGTARETGRRGDGTMTDDTVRAALAHILRMCACKRQLHLFWRGGEPLLAMPVVRRVGGGVAERCARTGTLFTSSLATNGTLLTPEAVDDLVRAGVTSVRVTVDVPRAAKRDRWGRDTMEKALDGAAAAAERLSTTLRVVIGRDNPREFDDLYRALTARGLGREKLGAIFFGWLGAIDCGDAGCGVRTMSPRAHLQVLTRECAKAAAAGFHAPAFLFHVPSACGATCLHQEVIDIDGLLYKCAADAGRAELSFGSVADRGAPNSDNIVPWLTYDWFQDERCRECPILPQCSGGCPHRRLRAAGSGAGRPDEDAFCLWELRHNLEDFVRSAALESSTTTTASTSTLKQENQGQETGTGEVR